MVQPVSFHVKVKRGKTTIFVECQVTDTALQLKQKIATMMGKTAKDIRLLWKDQQPLDDTANLTAAGITLDSVLTLVYWIPDEEDAQKSTWEPTPEIVPYPSDPLPQSQ